MSVNKSEVIKKHQQDAKDTGSPEVQVALISARSSPKASSTKSR